MVAAIVGFVTKNFWLALGCWLLAVKFKMWFVDRMTWIDDIMKNATSEYTNRHSIKGENRAKHETR